MQASRISCFLLVLDGLAACAPVRDAAMLSAEANRPIHQRRSPLAKEESQVTCAGLEKTISAEIAQMRELEKTAKIERNAPPTTMRDAWLRVFGEEGSGIPAMESHRKKRERVEAMNVELDKRGCPTVDIEQELKSPHATNKS